MARQRLAGSVDSIERDRTSLRARDHRESRGLRKAEVSSFIPLRSHTRDAASSLLWKGGEITCTPTRGRPRANVETRSWLKLIRAGLRGLRVVVVIPLVAASPDGSWSLATSSSTPECDSIAVVTRRRSRAHAFIRCNDRYVGENMMMFEARYMRRDAAE